MAAGAPLALAGTRRLMEQMVTGEAGAPVEAVLAARRQAWYSADAAEARAAFRERRPPHFKGE